MAGTRLGRVAVAALLVGAIVAGSPAPPATAGQRGGVCWISAVMSVWPGTAGTAVAMPDSGAYHMDAVGLVCAGAQATSPPGAQVSTTGMNVFISDGYTGTACGLPFLRVGGTEVPGVSQLCGDWTTGAAFSVSGDMCMGRIGGPGIWNNALARNWSMVAGNTIQGSIECTPTMTGTFSMVAVPWELGTVVGPVPPNASTSCGPSLPTPAWVCKTFVNGVIVFAEL